MINFIFKFIFIYKLLEDALSTAGLTNLWLACSIWTSDASFPHGTQQERTIKQG